MNNVVYGFLLTSIAGLSTMIGTFLIFFSFQNTKKIIAGSLSFAAGVMITVSITDLIPESLSMLNHIFTSFPMMIVCAIFVVIGIIFSIMIDKYLPVEVGTNDHKQLYRIGLISMIAIIFHNIPEGIATFTATNQNMSLGISLTIAIALHNIPEGISISIPIYYATKSRFKAILYTFISGISELFGAIIAYLFLAPFMNELIMGFLFAMIAGIMIYISIYELIPTSRNYKYNRITVVLFVIGAFFMLINHFVF